MGGERKDGTLAEPVASHRLSLSGSSKHDSTHRQLKSRHIQLIGIGGTIGTALYVRKEIVPSLINPPQIVHVFRQVLIVMSLSR